MQPSRCELWALQGDRPEYRLQLQLRNDGLRLGSQPLRAVNAARTSVPFRLLNARALQPAMGGVVRCVFKEEVCHAFVLGAANHMMPPPACDFPDCVDHARKAGAARCHKPATKSAICDRQPESSMKLLAHFEAGVSKPGQGSDSSAQPGPCFLE